MKLRGQQGYAMAVLLVAMSVAAVLMTAVMPTWKQMTRREKEAELIFRGEQYVRAIGLFQKRAGPGVLPPNLDVLVDQRFLRKKFKDPITNKDFDLLTPTTAAGRGGGAPGQPTTGAPGQQAQQGRGGLSAGAVIAPQGATAGRGATGIMGVASKSKDSSIRVYNGRTHYNEWQFVYVVQTQAPGAAGPGGAQRGGPGGQGQPPGIGGRDGGRGGQGGRGSITSPFGGGSGSSPFGGRPSTTPSPTRPR